MLRNARLAVAVCSVTASVLATFGLAACDDQGASDAASFTEPHGPTEGAHWQKVCSQEYFYRFSDAKTGEDSYCSEWQNKCFDKDGQPAEGCT